MITHTQYGEDAILEGVITRLEWVTGQSFSKETFLEIGGFHPVIHSIFYHFYTERGWRGSVYEPNTIHNDDFATIRPEDRLHNLAVAGQVGIAQFHIFSEGDSSNTIDADFALRKEAAQGTPVQRIQTVETITLKDAIALHIDNFQKEPLVISIDAEGLDFDIVEKYDFSTRPLFFLIEDEPGHGHWHSPLHQQMLWHKYRQVAGTVMTRLYMNERSPYFDALSKIGQK
jgi:hypothetical protein